MAAAYIKIIIDGECIRTFGGNVKDVRRMKKWYENCSYDEFSKNHPYLSYKQFETIKILYYRH